VLHTGIHGLKIAVLRLRERRHDAGRRRHDNMGRHALYRSRVERGRGVLEWSGALHRRGPVRFRRRRIGERSSGGHRRQHHCSGDAGSGSP
jgi:hypothetical protein